MREALETIQHPRCACKRGFHPPASLLGGLRTSSTPSSSRLAGGTKPAFSRYNGAIGWLLSLLLIPAAACAGRPDIHVAENADLKAYQRFAVVPYSEEKGLGRAYAEAMGKAIYALGRDIVPIEHVTAAFEQIGIKEGDELGLYNMLEIQKLTRADAVVFGSVHCGAMGKKQTTVLVLSTRGAEPLFRSEFRHEKCGTREGAFSAARLAAQSLGKVLAGKGLSDEMEEAAFE